MECPSCGAANPEDKSFCGDCGAGLAFRCPTCGAESPPGKSFCGECGAALGTAAEPPPATVPEAERRQLTVMFVDLVGSTELSGRLDPEDLREVMRRYQDAVSGVVARYEGHVAKFLGDGVLAYFGWPRAHEDQAERAVRAGLDAVAAVSGLKLDAGIELRARVGIATGQVVIGDLVGEAGAVSGETPNLAARLQEVAAVGEVAIGAATRRLVGEAFELVDLGSRVLKGFAEAVPVWRVSGERPAESRFEAAHAGRLTVFVGREEEVDLLVRRWQQAEDGEGQIVLLSGEAGIGKSRIAQTLRDRIADQRPVRLRLQCSPYHANSALYPFIGHLERASGFVPADGPEARLDKLEEMLALSTDDVARVAPLFGALLSVPSADRYPALELTPQLQKERTLEALADQLVGLAARRPVLMIFEDVHWADPTTLEALELVIDRVRDARVLGVITFRPEFAPPWHGHAHVTALALNRLGREQCAAMVPDVARGKPLPDEVLDQIVAKTDGVPLFVEELTKTVIESGILEEKAERYELTGPLPPLAIPSTLRDSLMARLDRLAPVKEVAQIGAAIGREFSHRLLAEVSPARGGELEDALDQLVASELVFRRGRPPDATYIFKHALVQDAAYESLLRSKRKELHRKIAVALREQFPAKAETEPDLLAHHYTEAGLVKEAVREWERAGDAALEGAALREATQHFRAALAQLALLPESGERDLTELGILTRFGSTVLNIEGWASSEAEILHERARELAGRLDNTSTELVSALVGLWLYQTTRARHDGAAEISQQLFHIARELDDPELLLQAHHAAWPSSMLRGDPSASSSSIDHGLAIYDETRHRHHAQIYMGHDPAVCGYSCGAIVKWALGLADQAAEYSNQAIALARRTEHVPSLVHGLILVCEWRVSMADHESALEIAEELYALSEAHQLAASRIVAQTFRGWARAKLGEVEQGIRDLRDGLDAWQSSGARACVPQRLSLLAAAYAANGDHDDALAALERALREIAETGERQYEAEIHFRRGRVLLDQNAGNRALAERSLRTSRDVARRQLALAYELRATVALAELWSDEGKRAEARESLAGVLDRFTEGFDTPDLKDAKAFLDELG